MISDDKQENSDAGNYYDALAPLYDAATAAAGSWNAPIELGLALKKLYPAGRPPAKSALVLGVGTGQDVKQLLDIGVGHIEGIDLSERMLEICRRQYPDITLRHGNCSQDFETSLEQYELIVCSGTAEFFPSLVTLFQNASQLLSVSGIFYLTIEPVIQHHNIQNQHTSTVLSSTGDGSAVPLTTYRRTLWEILDIANKANFSVWHHKEFVAYRKAECDIIYHQLIFQKK